MISSKKQEPEQDQSQQFGGKSPGNLDLEVSPPVIVKMRSVNHARLPCALQYDRCRPGIRRALIPAFFEIGFSSGEHTWVNVAANGAGRFDSNQTPGAPFNRGLACS